ncbi:MAG: efflux RND transporter periplasmic adaptor subunit [Planctomycetes bacterium]|nr:efflux RND transporter periplasmic adaptor subunit [Planctomycetota bacterium]
MTASDDNGGTRTATQQKAMSLTALQCDLRALFASRPTNRALLEVLQRIGDRLGAAYAVVHARLGVHLLSEEWQPAGHDVDNATREFVNSTLWEAISAEEATCTRVPGGDGKSVLITAIMYDQDIEPSGGAALVIRDCDKSRALQVLAQLEGVLGFLSLLIGGSHSEGQRLAERRSIEPHAAASHPVRLAYALISDLEARYGFDLTAIGFVDDHHVEIAAVSGVEDLRASNPGITVLRTAMEECLDRGEPIVYLGLDDGQSTDDCRLHAQWSAETSGNPVASLPLICMNEVVAVVSMSQGAGTKLTVDQVQLIAEEIAGYAALVPLTRAASRSVVAHVRDSLRAGARNAFGAGRRRGLIALAALLGLGLWLAFGTLDHTFTVPCVVKATERRTISCPRTGVLTELFVHPGDRVRAGQLLASLDANDEFLKRAELAAEIESLDALIDQAVADRDSGQRRTHEARKRSLLAQLAIVDALIGQAQIRAPQDGLILEGDLRENLGSRLKMGDRLFELARYDRASISLRIPEQLVLAAHEAAGARFAPRARPNTVYEIHDLHIAPASTVIEGHNVFLGEGTVPIDLDELPPGMEGTAHVDAGPRSSWWVLTHRVTDWLRLNFWL